MKYNNIKTFKNINYERKLYEKVGKLLERVGNIRKRRLEKRLIKMWISSDFCHYNSELFQITRTIYFIDKTKSTKI